MFCAHTTAVPADWRAPGRRTWFTVLGAGTLYGCPLHGFFAQGAKFWGWYDPAWVHQPIGALTGPLLALRS